METTTSHTPASIPAATIKACRYFHGHADAAGFDVWEDGAASLDGYQRGLLSYFFDTGYRPTALAYEMGIA